MPAGRLLQNHMELSNWCARAHCWASGGQPRNQGQPQEPSGTGSIHRGLLSPHQMLSGIISPCHFFCVPITKMSRSTQTLSLLPGKLDWSLSIRTGAILCIGPGARSNGTVFPVASDMKCHWEGEAARRKVTLRKEVTFRPHPLQKRPHPRLSQQPEARSSNMPRARFRTHCKKTEHQAPPLRHHGGCSLGSEEGISRCKIFSFLVSLRQQLLLPSAHALRSPGSGSVGPRCVEAGRVEVG